MSNIIEKRHKHFFVVFLEKLQSEGDKGAMATLRKGLGKPPGEVTQMYKYVYSGLGQDLSKYNEKVYFLVASLFALWYRGRQGLSQNFDGNLGKTYKHIFKATSADSTIKHFESLINSHIDDLPNHLRHAVSLASSKNIRIDWSQLLNDLKRWSFDDKPAQKEWMKSFILDEKNELEIPEEENNED